MQEILGGHYGEMRTMMQYFFQSSNFRGKDTQYRDLLRGVFLEEIAHVELVQNTINQLLNDSGESAVPGNAGVDHAPLDDAVKACKPASLYCWSSSFSCLLTLLVTLGMVLGLYSHGNLIG